MDRIAAVEGDPADARAGGNGIGRHDGLLSLSRCMRLGLERTGSFVPRGGGDRAPRFEWPGLAHQVVREISRAWNLNIFMPDPPDRAATSHAVAAASSCKRMRDSQKHVSEHGINLGNDAMLTSECVIMCEPPTV